MAARSPAVERDEPVIVRGLPPAAHKGQVVSFDFEIFRQGSRMHIPNGNLACLTLASPEWGKTVYLVDDVVDVRESLKRVKRAILAAHHALYDLRYLDKFGVKVDDLRVWDTEIADKVRFAGLYQRWGLDDCARRDLGLYLDKTLQSSFVDKDEMTPEDRIYAARDAWVTAILAAQQLAGDPADVAYYWKVEYPSLMAAYHLGPVQVDVDYWRQIAKDHEIVRDVMREDLGFNPGSPQQVVDAVKSRLGISLPNAQADTLEAYADRPLIQAILNYKESAKAVSTYGESWLEDAFEQAGAWWVQPGWNSCQAVTGRWSCEGPNLQNIPIRKDPRYRYAFIARKGRKRIKRDANQQEPRVLAWYSKDPSLMAALRAGISTHVLTGQVIFKDPNFSKKDPRYPQAKIVNLAVAYDMSEYGLAHNLGCTVEEARGFIQGYFRGMPGVAAYIQRKQSEVLRLGFIRTPLEKKIVVNQWSKNLPNMCANYPIQSGAAEITKRAVSLIWEMGNAAGFPFYVDLVVHDETVADVPTKEVKRYSKLMDEAWLQAAAEVIPGVPFATEAVVGDTWGGDRPK